MSIKKENSVFFLSFKLKTIPKIHIGFEHAKPFITFSVDLFPRGKLIRTINRVGMKVFFKEKKNKNRKIERQW